MAKDAELDRLKDLQDRAFQRQQDAYTAQNEAWKRRRATGDTMNGAYERKQQAYDTQDASWKDYQRIKGSNDPRIDSLKSLQQTAYENMVRAFENSKDAYNRKDGAGAKAYSEEGRRHQVEMQGYVAERRQLVAQNQAARARHDPNQTAFQSAKATFDSAQQAFNQAKSEHGRKQSEFKSAKAELAKASQAFQDRLKVVKAQSQKRRDDKRSIAEKAGVPYQYRDDVYVSTDNTGNTNIYFGGVGEPNGPGHGHYVMDHCGTVTYKRDPFDPHGGQNFVRDPDLENRLGAIALNIFHRERATLGPRTVQFDDGDVTVKVRSGFNHRTSTIATDFVIVDRSTNPDEHLHLILSEHDGRVLYSEWTKNHR